MKTITTLLTAAILFVSLAVYSADPPQPAEKDPKAEPTPPTEAAAPIKNPPPADTSAANSVGTTTNSDELRMNFQDASLDLVLKYLSEAAGFIVNIKPGTSVRGKVNILSAQPVTKDEAVDLLDTALLQNGLAAIRSGRVITIVNRDEAKTQHIPVFKEANPDKIPSTDRIVTQIIPVRFVEAVQLVKDLQSLVSMQTTMTANEAGNSIVITDTQANIHRVAEVIQAIDSGAEDFTEVRVFQLTQSDPTEMADLLTNLFPDDSKTGNTQSPFQGGPGGFRRFFGGGGPFGGGNQANNNAGGAQTQRIKKRNKVVAVADQRTTSLVVSASRDLMDQIEEVINKLDTNPKGKQVVTVLRTPNADPDYLKQVLQDLFNKRNTQNTRNSSQTGALQQRSTTQNQQNNSGSRSSLTPNSGRGGGGSPSFP